MIGRALDSGAAAAWVAADEVYGHDSKLRRFLEGRQMAYVLAVASDQRLWQPDFMQHRVDAIARSVTQIVSALWLLFDAAPHQKRPSPTILFRQLQQRPIIEPFALAAETGGKALPCRCGQTPRNCIPPRLHKIRLPQALV